MEKVLFTENETVLHKPQVIEQQQIENNEQVFDVDEVWKISKEQLRLYLSEQTRKMWFENVYLEKIETGIAEISCDTPYKRDWIESNSRAILKKILQNVTGQNLEIVVNIRQIFNKTQASERYYEYYDPASGQQSNIFNQATQKQNPPTESLFSPKYIFETFVVGASNRLAHAVAEAVAETPGLAYNPVFYYGGTGVGKTHLMQAIGNRVLQNDPTKKIVYSPIEKFLNEMIQAIRKKDMESFRNKYRNVDILIIDDIQFIGNYPKTQEEVFNTFNELYLANKQIIMASDRLPRDISNITDRLRSRFEGGMVVDIQPPDMETRIAIISEKIEEKQAKIPWEVVEFLASNIESNIRELEGAITKVISHTKFTGATPGIKDVEEMLQIDISSKRKRIKPKKILEAICEVFDTDMKELLGDRRVAYIALARQVAMYFLREELQLPLEKIAQEVNRKDHTTVLHAVDKIKIMYKENNSFAQKINKCKQLIRE